MQHREVLACITHTEGSAEVVVVVVVVFTDTEAVVAIQVYIANKEGSSVCYQYLVPNESAYQTEEVFMKSCGDTQAWVSNWWQRLQQY